MSGFTSNKAAGLALIVGVLLWFIAAFFTPGAIYDTEEGEFFLNRLQSMMDNDGLTHIMTMITILGITLQALGFSYLLRLPRQSGVGDLAFRFGVLATLLSWAILLAALGLQHILVYVLTEGVRPGMTEAARLDVGLTLYAAQLGVAFGSVGLGALAYILLGLGLAARLRTLRLMRIIGYAFVVTGIGGVFNLVFIEHLPNTDFGLLGTVSTVLAGAGGAWLLVIAYSMLRGQGELAPDAASG